MKKSAKLLIGTGTLCICMSLGLFGKMQIENAATAGQNNEIRDQFNEYLSSLDSQIHDVDTTLNNESLYIDGDLYMGIVRIETLDIELPVHYEWTYAKLKNSPCYYDGLVAENNLIIGAHNSAVHFGTLYKLENGDIVEFIDPSGNVYTYEVADSYIIHETEVEELNDTSNGDLTLFTCHTDSSYRRVIRCLRVTEAQTISM